MATVRKTKPTDLADRVELRIPRSNTADEQNVFISVNGKNYLIPKGQAVWVPPEVYEEYMRAEEARENFITAVEVRKQAAN